MCEIYIAYKVPNKSNILNPFYIEKNGVKIGGSKRIKEMYLEKTGISDGKEWHKYHSNYDIWKTERVGGHT